MGVKKLKRKEVNPFREWYDNQTKINGVGPNQSQIARELNIKHQTVWNWLSGHSRPNERVLLSIHFITGIEPLALLEWVDDRHDWDSE